MKAYFDIIKYPRTQHIEGSSLSTGDDLDVVKFSDLIGKDLVFEEKVDGANVGVSFHNDTCDLLLQSRGHYLVGGDWPEFDMFKTWANTSTDQLFDILESRYIMYAEWMYAFHSVYYDKLPHYLMEFDIYDKQEEVFLDTERRLERLNSTGWGNIKSAPVVGTVKFSDPEELFQHVYQRSLFVSDDATDALQEKMIAKRYPESLQKNLLKLNTDKMREGVYVKWEEDGIVKGRYKFVRKDFTQTILQDEVHWSSRPTIVNGLSDTAELY